MTPKHLRPIVLLSGPRSLTRFERQARASGRKVARLVTVEFVSRPAAVLRSRLERFGPFDTLVITSPEAAQNFLRPMRFDLRGALDDCEVVSSGARTATSARALGWRRVRIAEPWGAEGIARYLARRPRRRIVYPRSSRAGPGLARRLRAEGHTVLDLIAYRVVAPNIPPAQSKILRGACTLVVTSPSAISNLRRAIPPRTFRRLTKFAETFVLGSRTARALYGHGFRRVRQVAADGVGGFVTTLVGAVCEDDGPSA